MVTGTRGKESWANTGIADAKSAASPIAAFLRRFTRECMCESRAEFVWRECMGIEPTQPGGSRVACGFEDRDGHQAASTPLLHNDEPFSARNQHFSDSSRTCDAGKIFADPIGPKIREAIPG